MIRRLISGYSKLLVKADGIAGAISFANRQNLCGEVLTSVLAVKFSLPFYAELGSLNLIDSSRNFYISLNFCSINTKQVTRLVSCLALGIAWISLCGSAAMTSEPHEPALQLSQTQPQQWRRMTSDEQANALQYILNSPLGIAALNQLAIEGFISPGCPKTFYLNENSGGFQTLLRVKCPNQRGVSSAVGYNEIRAIFNRFESNIEDFKIERVSSEGRSPSTTLPD
jgi:hypothetical protein